MKRLPLPMASIVMSFVVGNKNHWRNVFNRVIRDLATKIEYLAFAIDIQERISSIPSFITGCRHVSYSRSRPPTILYELSWANNIGPRTISLQFQNGAWGLETYRFFYYRQSPHIRRINNDEYGDDDRCNIHFDHDAFWVDVKEEIALRMQ